MNHLDDWMSQPLEAKTRLDNAIEPTPEGFHRRLEGQLSALRGQEAVKPTRTKARWLSLVLAGALLLGATAFAASKLGVLYFLTERTTEEIDVEKAEQSRVQAITQACQSEVLRAEIRDAIWREDIFSICLYVEPLDPGLYAMLCENSIGTDGEHSAWVWWKGKVYESLAEWMPQGKQALVTTLPDLKLGGYPLARSCVWVPEGNGLTFLLEVDVSDMEIIHEIRPQDLIREDGTIEAALTLSCFIDGTGEPLSTTVAGFLPWRLEEEE